AEERAEEQPGETVEKPAVEADEENTACQSERLNGADDRGLLAVRLTGGRSRHHGYYGRGGDSGAEVPHAGADADQDGSRRPGEGNYRQGMACEALVAEDHVPPEGAGNYGDDGPGPQGVHHEVVREQLANVGAKVPAQPIGTGNRGRGHHGWEA